MSGLFRASVLDKASAPEQLDHLVTVTRPGSWAALAAVLALLSAVLVWSLLGSIPTTVKGNGLLLAEGGQVHEAAAEGAGTVAELLVGIGQRVARDAPVAHILLPELTQSIAAQRDVVAEREAELERVRAFAGQTAARQASANIERRAALTEILAAARERESQLMRRVTEQEGLLAQGVATRPVVLAARSQANQASQEVADARNQILQLGLAQLDLAGQNEQRIAEAERILAETRRRLAELEARLERQRVVRAPAGGRVTEIRVPRGAATRPGEAVLTIEDGAERLELVLFIPPKDGRRVRPGMAVRVSPSTARWEEYGAMLGHVIAVSEFPATREGMAALLRNNELVTTFTRDGPPYLARVRLEPDPATVSGYRWSSARGAVVAVSTGTLARGDVRVAEQAPITLALPLLRELSGVDF